MIEEVTEDEAASESQVQEEPEAIVKEVVVTEVAVVEAATDSLGKEKPKAVVEEEIVTAEITEAQAAPGSLVIRT